MPEKKEKNGSLNGTWLKGKYTLFCDKFHQFRTWTGGNPGKDSVILAVLSLFYFVWRFLSLGTVSSSGDNIWKWSFLRYFHETGVWFPAAVDHHQGRWTQNLPVLGLMKLFDSTDVWIYYTFPIFCGLLFLILCYLITRFFADQFLASLAFLTPIFFSVFHEESCQLLPSLPTSVFELAALYITLWYVKNPQKWWLLFFTGLAMGCAWGGKVTAGYWCVGITLFLCFFPPVDKSLFSWKKFHISRAALAFVSAFVLVLVIETLLLHHFFHVPNGRVSMVMTHSGNHPTHTSVSLLRYLFSFPIIPFFPGFGKWYDLVPRFFLFILSIGIYGVLLFRKDSSLPKRFLAFCFFVDLFLHCYMVVKVFPLKYPERPLLRYFLTMNAVGFIGIFAFWKEFTQYLSEKIHPAARWVCAFCFISVLIPMFVGTINESFCHHDDIFCIIRNHRIMKTATAHHCPTIVLFQGKNSSKTKKTAAQWLACYGKTEVLPFLMRLPDDPSMTADSTGRLYMQIDGADIPPGKPTECLVLEKHIMHLRTIDFPQGSKTVSLQ